ncbi:MAG: hypothetical protein M0R17_05790 [Candidatus Omnitrophica bacterium]|jgi:hypothetical protein|nr:hypothetical protein [Candidatus Omnitrophota bacterium]
MTPQKDNQEICENCGYPKIDHWMGKYCEWENGIGNKNKKFTPRNNQQKQTHDGIQAGNIQRDKSESIKLGSEKQSAKVGSAGLKTADRKSEENYPSLSGSSTPKHHGITITDVKIVGLCSKHRKEGDKVPRYTDGRIVPDEDIACIEEAFGSSTPNEIERIKNKPIKDRTQKEHLILIEKVYKNSMRNYFLSMGGFKDIPIEEGSFTPNQEIIEKVKQEMKCEFNEKTIKAIEKALSLQKQENENHSQATNKDLEANEVGVSLDNAEVGSHSQSENKSSEKDGLTSARIDDATNNQEIYYDFRTDIFGNKFEEDIYYE